MEVSVQTQSIDVYFEHIFGYIISNPRVLLFCLASFAISALLIPLIIKVCSNKVKIINYIISSDIVFIFQPDLIRYSTYFVFMLSLNGLFKE